MSAQTAKAVVTLIAVLSYAIMAGFFTQSGIVLAPAAAHFGRSVPATAGAFSWLIGGNLAGIVVSLGIFRVCSVRATFVIAYAVMIAGIGTAGATHLFGVAEFGIALIGFGGGLGLSTGAVLIAKTYAGNVRAIAFLSTDCAFSVAGFVFPAVAATLIARGYGWSSGYAAVGALAAAVAVASFAVPFPRVDVPQGLTGRPRAAISSTAYVRVALVAVALACYLGGQSVFLLWTPTYLTSVFGLAPPAAGAAIGNFWGPSIFGLIAAALITSRVAPRIVLTAVTIVALGILTALAVTGRASTFLTLTLAFGFFSTSMYKLLISVGSEQIAKAPPQLITVLLLAGGVGGTLAPVVSASIVRVYGPHVAPSLTLICYAIAFAAIVATLAMERAARARPAALAVQEAT